MLRDTRKVSFAFQLSYTVIGEEFVSHEYIRGILDLLKHEFLKSLKRNLKATLL